MCESSWLLINNTVWQAVYSLDGWRRFGQQSEQTAVIMIMWNDDVHWECPGMRTTAVGKAVAASTSPQAIQRSGSASAPHSMEHGNHGQVPVLMVPCQLTGTCQALGW